MQAISIMLSKYYVREGLVWLFHVSGIIGIYLGFEEWFLEKTPLNLLVCFVLLLLAFPIKSLREAVAVYSFFAVGMLAEWSGVHYGFPFGEYYYGENLGVKLDGVPVLIGINWAMLVLITGSISIRVTQHLWLRVLLGAVLMVFLDFFIEPNASYLDFWHWENDRIPVSNYVGWLVIAAFLQYIFQQAIKEINFRFSINLYLAQLLFFASIYVYTLI